MINLVALRENQQTLTALLQKKDPAYDVQRLLDLDARTRSLRAEVEQLRSKKNDLAKQAQGGITQEVREQSVAVGKELKEKEQHLVEVEQEFKELYLFCPNIPDAEIPAGNKEANLVVKTVGSKPTFDFTPQHHVDLGNKLGWFDFEAAVKMTGGNFALYKGDAVRLLYSLTMMMFKNNIKHGFEPILPPYLVNEKSLEVASNFPKFKDQVYSIGADNLYMTPTAEVNLTNLYRDHIFAPHELPVRMTAWTSCFRREAGTYGSTERGLIRIHQFEKLELYTLCEPERVEDEHKRMLACAEDILQQLGLHYRVSLLAAQDCSFASAKTFDIEVWMPGQGAYYEVSSSSNCTDFQARRGMIRYKKTQESKTELVYTLNSSSLALPRLMVALMETYQQPDGSIAFPDVLKKEGLLQ